LARGFRADYPSAAMEPLAVLIMLPVLVGVVA